MNKKKEIDKLDEERGLMNREEEWAGGWKEEESKEKREERNR